MKEIPMNTFFTADTHYGHANVLNFTRDNGRPLRDFANVEEMNETLIERHNAVVGKYDQVYHLGDAVFGQANMHLLKRLHGKLILIAGNHDHYGCGLASYADYFDQILGSKTYSFDKQTKGIISHIPVHPEQLKHRFGFNLHGHFHDVELDDPRYLNLGVECWDYTPVHWDEIKAILQRKGIL
jgi:calcineurin-like phosphoesterase family protein